MSQGALPPAGAIIAITMTIITITKRKTNILLLKQR